MGKFDERDKRIMDNTKRILFDQIEQLTAGNDINVQDLHALYEAYDVIKDIQTMCAMDEAGSYDDYSYYMDYEDNPEKLAHTKQMSYYDRTRVPYYDPSYTDGMIMHRRSRSMRHADQNGNTNGAMRNSDGQYMSHADDQDYSRTRTMQHLERMLDQAATDEERKTIIKCMNKL